MKPPHSQSILWLLVASIVLRLNTARFPFGISPWQQQQPQTSPQQQNATSELILLQIIFRHGDRTPLRRYATDPYPESAFPEGYGNLFNRRKQRILIYGELLKQRYANYIGMYRLSILFRNYLIVYFHSECANEKCARTEFA